MTQLSINDYSAFNINNNNNVIDNGNLIKTKPKISLTRDEIKQLVRNANYNVNHISELLKIDLIKEMRKKIPHMDPKLFEWIHHELLIYERLLIELMVNTELNRDNLRTCKFLLERFDKQNRSYFEGYKKYINRNRIYEGHNNN